MDSWAKMSDNFRMVDYIDSATAISMMERLIARAEIAERFIGDLGLGTVYYQWASVATNDQERADALARAARSIRPITEVTAGPK